MSLCAQSAGGARRAARTARRALGACHARARAAQAGGVRERRRAHGGAHTWRTWPEASHGHVARARGPELGTQHARSARGAGGGRAGGMSETRASFTISVWSITLEVHRPHCLSALDLLQLRARPFVSPATFLRTCRRGTRMLDLVQACVLRVLGLCLGSKMRGGGRRSKGSGRRCLPKPARSIAVA